MSYNQCFESYYTADALNSVGRTIVRTLHIMYNAMCDSRTAIIRTPTFEIPSKRFNTALVLVNRLRIDVEEAIDHFEKEFPNGSTLSYENGVPIINTAISEFAVNRFFELLFDSYYVYWKHEKELLPYFEEYLKNVESRISNIIKPDDLQRLNTFYREQCAERRRIKDEKYLGQIRRVREALKEDFPKRKRVENVEEEVTLTFSTQVHSSIVHAVDEDDDDDDEATQPPPGYVEEEGEEEEEDAQEPATKKIKKEM